MLNCDLSVFICVDSPDRRSVQIGTRITTLPTDYYLDKTRAAEGVQINGVLLYHLLLFRSKKTLGPAIRKICKYHDRFDNWPIESLMLRCILEQLWWGRVWLKITDFCRKFVNWLDFEKPLNLF